MWRSVADTDLERGGDACRGASAVAGRNKNAGVEGDRGAARPWNVVGSGGNVWVQGDACGGAWPALTLGRGATRAAVRRRRRAATAGRVCRSIAAAPAHGCRRAAAATFGGWATRAAARRVRREGPLCPTDEAAATHFVEISLLYIRQERAVVEGRHPRHFKAP